MSRIVVLGSLNLDLAVPVPHLPRAGETLSGGDLALFEGGKGANQAYAVSRLGGDAVMIGQVGRDAFGIRLVEALRRAGVDVTGVGTSDRPTGTASIFVAPDGENVIVVSPGANATVTPDVARDRVRAASPCAYLLTQLETPLPAMAAACAEARRLGATTILDPAPAQALPAEFVPLIDIVTPNQGEAAALLGHREAVQTVDHALQVADALRQQGYRAVVIKLGSLGCIVADDHARAVVPAVEVVAVDTTGAGDTFNGALAVALAQGASLERAARFANAAAALSVTRHGAQASVPTRAEVNALLARG